MDIATLLGFIVGPGAIIGSFLFEGGKMSAIEQPTAFCIVVGGTIGALCIQFPASYLIAALKAFAKIVMPNKHDNVQLVKDIVVYAQKARREGVVALEADATASSDPFLQKALGLAVDGTESRIIRDALEIEIHHLGEHGEYAPKVFEAGGAFAPTFGIIGAVLGLIQVMQNLADPSKLGAGIAVAFVATVYALFFANLIFLPIGGKLKLRHAENMVRYDLILSGICAIVEGENPRIIEQKLMGYCGDHGHGKGAGGASEKAAA
jgi:chemotaxis protein MotA